MPALRQRLAHAPAPWRRPRWVTDDSTDVGRRVREVRCGRDGIPGTLSGVVDAFFSTECDPYRRPWEIWLIPGAAHGRTAVAVKVHHTLGDSRIIISALTALLDGPSRQGPTAGRGGMPARGERPGRRDGARALARDCLHVIRGLGHLAAAGRAPGVSVCGPFTASRRRYLPVALPARDAARTARRLDAQISDLLLAVIADALGRVLRARGEETGGQLVRIAVPRAVAATGRSRLRGAPPRNQTAAVTLDVPVGPATPAQRLAAVRGQLAAHERRGDTAAAAIVLRAMNLLPPPVQRLAALQLYRRRWFNLLVSVFPGTRRSYRLLGARVEEAYPVLALADGVGLAVGAMTWEHSLSVGVLADAALVPDADKLAVEISAAFNRYRQTAATSPPPKRLDGRPNRNQPRPRG